MAVQQRAGWIIVIDGFQQIGGFYKTETAANDAAETYCGGGAGTMIVIPGTVFEFVPEETP